MRKRLIAAVLSLAMLCSCTSGGNGIVYEELDNDVNISLAWWGNDERVNYTMDGVAEFEKQNSGIEVTMRYGVWNGYIKRQNIYMMSHEEPDVMLVNFDWLSKYSKDGNGFYDLNKLKDEIDLSNFTEEELAYGKKAGKLNALPTAINAFALFANKDIYDKYGLEIPKTWDDYFECAKVMREDGVYPLALGDKAGFFLLLAYLEQTTGKQACDENGKLQLTVDDIAYILRFYKKLVDEKALLPITDSDYKPFASGQCASVMRWISGSQTLFNDIFDDDVNIVTMPYPREPGAKSLGWYAKPATMYAISADTKHPKEAGMLLNFLINDPDMARLQKTEKGVPVSKSAVEALKGGGALEGLDYGATKEMQEAQAEMHSIPSILEDTRVYQGFLKNSVYYIYEREEAEVTAKRMYDEFYAAQEG